MNTEEEKRMATAVRKLKKSIDDNRRLDARCNVYYETIEQQALQLKALQDASLEAVKELGNEDAGWYLDHSVEARLREVLIGQGVSQDD